MSLAVAIAIFGSVARLKAASNGNVASEAKNFYLPDAAASKIVSVTKGGTPEAEVTILTEAVAVKETGPKETVAKFGEVYAFAPSFIAVNRDAPTMLTFWNLQPDDEHDFMLTAPDGKVLMHAKLAPLTKESYVFTFHREGIFNFYCAVHQPEMAGQILVLASEKDNHKGHQGH